MATAYEYLAATDYQLQRCFLTCPNPSTSPATLSAAAGPGQFAVNPVSAHAWVYTPAPSCRTTIWPSLAKLQISEPEIESTRPDAKYRQDWVLRKLFGEHHWCLKWVSELCKADPAFFEHLTEQTAAYPHYLAIVRLFLLGRPPEQDLPNSEQAQQLRTRSRKAVLDMLQIPLPSSLLKLLPKLGPNPLSKNDYRHLLTAIKSPTAIQFLRHRARIRSYHLKWLQDFPGDLLPWQLLNSVKKTEDYRRLQYIGLAIRGLRAHEVLGEHHLDLRQLRTLDQLSLWFDRKLLAIRFPAPPWNGTESISPVRTVKELYEVGLQFRNCIYEYKRAVLEGRRYFYVSTRGPAVVSIRHDLFIGWGLDEATGMQNKALPKAATKWIIQQFLAAGIVPLPTSEIEFVGMEETDDESDFRF